MTMTMMMMTMIDGCAGRIASFRLDPEIGTQSFADFQNPMEGITALDYTGIVGTK